MKGRDLARSLYWGAGFVFGLTLLLGLFLASGPRVAFAQTDTEGCLNCHAYGMTTAYEGKEVSLQVDPAEFGASPHGNLPCTVCHTQNHGPLEQVEAAAKQACATCHQGHDFGAQGVFIHPDPPLACDNCHGPVHAVVPASAPASPLNRANVVGFCGSCHGKEKDAYLYSYHGAAYRLGSTQTPICADCHGHLSPVSEGSQGAGIEEPSSSCGKCHAGGSAALAKLVESGKEHVTPQDRTAGIDGLARWAVWKFFLLLILFNVSKDGVIAVLDLTHRWRKANGNGKTVKGGRR